MCNMLSKVLFLFYFPDFITISFHLKAVKRLLHSRNIHYSEIIRQQRMSTTLHHTLFQRWRLQKWRRRIRDAIGAAIDSASFESFVRLSVFLRGAFNLLCGIIRQSRLQALSTWAYKRRARAHTRDE